MLIRYRISARYFYPRSPCGERPQSSSYNAYMEEFLSTLSLRRATRVTSSTRSQPSISIHALLAESDTWARGSRVTYVEISIHALLAESDIQWEGMKSLSEVEFLSTLSLRRATPSLYQLYDTYAFLSTLSLRRATCGCFGRCRYWAYFYPRSPCGERHTTRQNTQT